MTVRSQIVLRCCLIRLYWCWLNSPFTKNVVLQHVTFLQSYHKYTSTMRGWWSIRTSADGLAYTDNMCHIREAKWQSLVEIQLPIALGLQETVSNVNIIINIRARYWQSHPDDVIVSNASFYITKQSKFRYPCWRFWFNFLLRHGIINSQNSRKCFKVSPGDHILGNLCPSNSVFGKNALLN